MATSRRHSNVKGISTHLRVLNPPTEKIGSQPTTATNRESPQLIADHNGHSSSDLSSDSDVSSDTDISSDSDDESRPNKHETETAYTHNYVDVSTSEWTDSSKSDDSIHTQTVTIQAKDNTISSLESNTSESESEHSIGTKQPKQRRKRYNIIPSDKTDSSENENLCSVTNNGPTTSSCSKR